MFDYSTYFVLQTDALHPDSTYEATLEAALAGGVSIVQIREKNASTRTFLNLATAAQKHCKRYQVPLIINDRVDIALAISADGVHIGQDDMPIAMARLILGKDKVIGVSCNTVAEAQAAVAAGADYLGAFSLCRFVRRTGRLILPGIGPCFETNSKIDAKSTIGPRGVAAILEAVSSDIPTVVIGFWTSPLPSKCLIQLVRWYQFEQYTASPLWLRGYLGQENLRSSCRVGDSSFRFAS